MAYSDFTFRQLNKQFGLTEERKVLFPQISPVEPSDWLLKTLEIGRMMPYTTEKMRSERIVSPILLEISSQNPSEVAVFSGHNLPASPQTGLNGECDFILAKGLAGIEIVGPIMAVVEAKKGDVETALSQCAAQLLGVQLYNQNDGFEIPKLYGCVTSGTDWLFIELNNNVLYIDQDYYFYDQLSLILGVFQSIINQTRLIESKN